MDRARARQTGETWAEQTEPVQLQVKWVSIYTLVAGFSRLSTLAHIFAQSLRYGLWWRPLSSPGLRRLFICPYGERERMYRIAIINQFKSPVEPLTLSNETFELCLALSSGLSLCLSRCLSVLLSILGRLSTLRVAPLLAQCLPDCQTLGQWMNKWRLPPASYQYLSDLRSHGSAVDTFVCVC